MHILKFLLAFSPQDVAKSTNMISQQVGHAPTAARMPDMPAKTQNPASQSKYSSFLLECNFKTFE